MSTTAPLRSAAMKAALERADRISVARALDQAIASLRKAADSGAMDREMCKWLAAPLAKTRDQMCYTDIHIAYDLAFDSAGKPRSADDSFGGGLYARF